MRADLKADCRLFTQTDERLSERVFDPLARKRGITAEMVEAEYAKDRREAIKRYEPEPFTTVEDSA